MKKTWITKAMIALMTLALVAGVFIIAPKEAQAEAPTITTTQGEIDNNPATANSAWSQNFSASDTTATWAMTSGPAWLSFANNTLSGTAPTTGGEFTFYVTATVGTEACSPVEFKLSVRQAPTISPSTLTFTTPKVNEAMTAIPVSATGYPAPAISVTGLDGTGLEYSGGTIHGTPTAVVTSRTVTISASNIAGTATPVTGTLTIAQGTSTVTVAPGPTAQVALNDFLDLSAGGIGDGPIQWEYTAGTGTGSISSASGSTTRFTPATAGTVTVKATRNAGTNYAASSSYTTTITITAANPTLAINYPINGATYAPGDPVPLSATVTGGTFTSWATNGKGAIGSTTASTTTYTVSSQDAGKTVTFTATAGATVKTASIYVSNNTMVSSPSADGGYTLPNVGSTTPLTVASTNGSALEVWNTAPCNVEVKATLNGKETIIGEAHTQVPSGTTFTVKGLITDTRSYVKIKPAGASDTAIRTMNYFVGSTTPKITAQFWSTHNDNTLSRYATYGTLKITVTNYNKSYPYVTIRRNNVRTFVQAGSYSSHANTYDYTLQLKQEGDANDGVAYAIIEPQYNGSTHYTVSHQGATTVNTSGIYVTGFPALPQTGPDYTLAYVLGGLCLVTAVTAVTLHVRKKKQKKQGN